MKKLVLNKKFLGSVLTIYLPCFILFASPYVAWTGNYGRQAISASGDYPFIFLINPISFIQHVAFHVFQSNAGAESLLPYLSMAVLATPFKIIGLNPQLVIVGLLLSATYLGMVLFVQEFMKDKDDFPAVGMLAGTVAVFAPLISQNVFYYFSPSMVLIPFVPWFCLTLKKYCDSGNSKYIYFSSLQIFMASAGLTDIPDALPTIFLVVMLSMFIFMHEKKLNVLTLSRVFDLVILSIFIK